MDIVLYNEIKAKLGCGKLSSGGRIVSGPDLATMPGHQWWMKTHHLRVPGQEVAECSTCRAAVPHAIRDDARQDERAGRGGVLGASSTCVSLAGDRE
ncbi:hypothetical protein PR003_g8206 [Phytophthora rubi]|uniref:Uncharacterized protein n=1 Tax=Phytophthora rubi TaxID=129364 RepID=A0A6A3N189_9STRA|nr:hypothetical protein PR002_g7939 [Phytophthora rubi]KAE9344930.1 hypothetical protein PR003_g8206 [Phytophthora rubi]